METLRESNQDIEVRLERVMATKILMNNILNEMVKRVDNNFDDIQSIKECQNKLDIEKIVDRVLASERLQKHVKTTALQENKVGEESSVSDKLLNTNEQINILKHKQEGLHEQYNLLKINDRIAETEDKLIQNIQEIRDEVRSNPSSSTEKDGKGRCCKERLKEDAKRKEEIKMLKGHIENIEHLLFTGKSQDLELKWVLSNYEHHSRTGNSVFSPIFYTQLNGNRFQLGISWSGAEQESLEVCLYLRHGKNNSADLKQLTIPFTVGIVNQKDNYTSCINFKNSEDSDASSAEPSSATQPSGEGKKRQLYFPCLIPLPCNETFLHNDSITLYCTFDCSKVVFPMHHSSTL